MNAAYHFAEAWRGLRRAPGVGVASAVSLLAAFLVLAGVADALWNGWRLVRAVEARKELVVILKDNSTADADSTLGARLKGLEEVEAVTYVSRDSAWAQLSREMSADPELLQAVGANPLPASYRVRLKPGNREADQMRRLAQGVKQYPEVSDVLFGGEWVERLEAWLRRFTWVGLALGAGVALSVVVLVMLTIRLALLARRDVLRVLRLIGARENFVRMPFLLEGLLLALGCSIVALAAVEGLSLWVATRWTDWAGMPWTLDLAFVGLALVLGLLGSLVGSLGVGREEVD